MAYTTRLSLLCWGISPRRLPCKWEEDKDGPTHAAFLGLSPLTLIRGVFLGSALPDLDLSIALPLALKNLTLLTVWVGANVGLIITWLPRAQKNSRVWTWGALWSLPFFSASPFSGPTLRGGHLARALDLSWLSFTSSTLWVGRGALASREPL